MNGPELPADLFVDDGTEAPRVDLCRPHGIPINRNLCPPDDDITDRFAALAAQIDADLHDLDVAPATPPAGVASSTRDRSTVGPLPSTGHAWDMWTDVPL